MGLGCALSAEIRYIIIARSYVRVSDGLDQCYKALSCRNLRSLELLSLTIHVLYLVYVRNMNNIIEYIRSTMAFQFLIPRSKCPGLGGSSPISHSVWLLPSSK